MKLTTFNDAIISFFQKPSAIILTVFVVVSSVIRLFVRWDFWDPIIVVATVAIWPIQEWFVHLYVLHIKPFKLFGYKIDPEFARIHRVHHAEPNDLEDTLLTPRVVLQAVGLYAGFWFLLFPVQYAMTGFATTMILGLHYEWCHFVAHIPYTPKWAFYKMLKKHHLLHHFKNENYWFGVSGTTGDQVLGTCPDHTDVPKSSTCCSMDVE